MIDPNHPHKLIGDAIVKHVNTGTKDDTPVWDAHFAKDWTSIEGTGGTGPDGRPMVYEGRAAIEAKCKAWVDAHTIHSSKAEGPYVGMSGFAVKYTLDVEPKDGSWPRMMFQEIGVYTVNDGKVTREEFWYMPMCPDEPGEG